MKNKSLLKERSWNTGLVLCFKKENLSGALSEASQVLPTKTANNNLLYDFQDKNSLTFGT